MECPSRPHCPICHSRNHTIEQCEYNILNCNTATTVHQIEPHPNPAQPPPLPKEAPRPWEDNRLHYHTANAPDTTCCNRENPYRNDTQPHPNHVQQTNGSSQHCGQGYNYQPYRGFRHNRGSQYFGNRRHFHNRCRDQQHDNTWHNHPMEPRVTPVKGYNPAGHDDQLPNPASAPFEHGDPSTSAPITCFSCNQPGHFANQCPNDSRGKAPAINMITLDVQHVMTRRKIARSSWETQDSIR